jgi:WD40 repeat protein
LAVNPGDALAERPLIPTLVRSLQAHFADIGHIIGGMAINQDILLLLWLTNIRRTVRRVSLATLVGHADAVYAVGFSRDYLLATGSVDRTVRLWNVANPQRPRHITTLSGHALSVVAVAFSPDGRLLATAARTTRYVCGK